MKKAAVVGLNGDAMELTGDRNQLLRRVETIGLMQATGVQRLDDIGAHVLKTVTVLSRELVERPGGRKAIVGIGPASLFDTPIPNPIVGPRCRFSTQTSAWVNDTPICTLWLPFSQFNVLSIGRS